MDNCSCDVTLYCPRFITLSITQLICCISDMHNDIKKTFVGSQLKSAILLTTENEQ